MCGKFTQMMGWSRLVELAGLIAAAGEGPVETVTPMRFATVIRRNAAGARETARMRWGLVPHWEKDPSIGTKFIHARAETIEQKRTFRDAFFERRGLVVVNTFNEGEEVTPKKTRQHTITPRDGMPMAIAVVWERWGEGHDASLLTFAMVTVPANTLISAIADRMPAIVAYEDWAKWLGEEPASVDELKAVLKPSEGDWEMKPQDPKSPPPPRPKSAGQETLF
jgi:putative SOS response-associated peptidase YedK